jgi:uncharacterized repeat protein (TIGR03803 family)
MHHKGRFPNVFFGANLRPDSAALAIMILLLFLIFVLLFMTLTAQPAQAQSFQVIYNFTGGADSYPEAGLTIDRAGSLYGTTAGFGDCNGCGEVFRLDSGPSGWNPTTLHRFTGGSDGSIPFGRVIFGPDGNLYGTTWQGGNRRCGTVSVFGNGCGTVFKVSPTGGDDTVLYRFMGSTDGQYPESDTLVFDQVGNLYGTTITGGLYHAGSVFKLTPSSGGWRMEILYSFAGGADGYLPGTGVIFDGAGNLYGATGSGGDPGCSQGWGCGTVFQLTPSGSGWTKRILHTFTDGTDGGNPTDGLFLDKSGNLYGSTGFGGTGCQACGTVYELSPASGGWTFRVIYSFAGWAGSEGSWGTLNMDAAGNLYGTGFFDGPYGAGTVFKLTPPGSGWTYTSLHNFTGGSDGEMPVSNVTFDANGNMFGTTSNGGAYRLGVVWEITP